MFASAWNGISLMREVAPTVEIWSNASGSLGYGAIWDTHWCQVGWSQWPDFAGASMAAKKLLPIVVAVVIWGSQWRGATVLCHCDNEAVVASLKASYCKEPMLAHMLRCLFFVEAKYDMSLSALHIPGVKNKVADSISRYNLSIFFTLLPQADPEPCAVPNKVVKQIIRERTWTSADLNAWLEILSRDH